MNQNTNFFIKIKNCNIENKKGTVLSNISWQMEAKQAWLVVGPNGGGKADFIKALAGQLSVNPAPCAFNADANAENSIYANAFSNSVEVVSLERAAALIQEERELDESEYVEGGVDVGRTGRIFIGEALVGPIKKGTALPEIVKRIETLPEIKLCGVEKILDRGLKYMSTGEIRRTLLARALLSKKKLLILSDPFAGLDVESRAILLDFFNTIAKKQLIEEKLESAFPRIILSMERYTEIPQAITNVIEFTEKKVSFCGSRTDFEKVIFERNQKNLKNREAEKKAFAECVKKLSNEVDVVMGVETNQNESDVLIDMKNVNVGWGDHKVLRDFNWQLCRNEHWLIQGPNGSGKTTFLELITGDNMQVFSNDIKLFGARRGSGETIWDIKHKLGIVSYRLHVEYRMVGGTSLRNVIISGFHDSIGLYETPTDIEIAAAEQWLNLGGFTGRGSEMFSNLSYGEQRAILILRAAVKCPQIMILDEPCHGLDDAFRNKILDLLEIIAESGTTTLLHVTHEMSEVLPCEKHILQLVPNENPMYKIKVC